MEEKELERKLKNVKDSVFEVLGNNELENCLYYQTVKDLLLKEGIMKTQDDIRLHMKVATGLLSKLNLEESYGLVKAYVRRRDVPFSDEAKMDLDNYRSLEDSTLSHLKKEIGDRKILKSEYERMIESYLETYNWPVNWPVDVARYMRFILKIKLSVALEKHFRYEKEPEMIGGYDCEVLDRALSNI